MLLLLRDSFLFLVIHTRRRRVLSLIFPTTCAACWLPVRPSFHSRFRPSARASNIRQKIHDIIKTPERRRRRSLHVFRDATLTLMVMMGIRPADFSRLCSRRPDLILFFVLDSDDYSSSRCAHNNNNNSNSQTGEKRVKESTRVFLYFILPKSGKVVSERACFLVVIRPYNKQTRDDVVVVFFSGIYYKIVRVCCTFPVLFP